MLSNQVIGICVYAQKTNHNVEVTTGNIDIWQDWGSFELFVSTCLTSKGQAELILASCSAAEDTTVVPTEVLYCCKDQTSQSVCTCQQLIPLKNFFGRCCLCCFDIMSILYRYLYILYNASTYPKLKPPTKPQGSMRKAFDIPL